MLAALPGPLIRAPARHTRVKNDFGMLCIGFDFTQARRRHCRYSLEVIHISHCLKAYTFVAEYSRERACLDHRHSGMGVRGDAPGAWGQGCRIYISCPQSRALVCSTPRIRKLACGQ